MNSKFATALIATGLMLLTGVANAQDKAGTEKPDPPDPKVIGTIFGAFAGGLPEKWNRAWVVVAEMRAESGARDFEVQCLVTVPGANSEGETIPSCDRKAVFENVWSLNRNLPSPEKRRWTSATLVFMPDGKFELKYEYKNAAEPKAKNKN